MAYLDLDDIFAAPAASRPAASADAPAEAGFSPLEWHVIALAERDTLRSLAKPGRIARAMGRLFGFKAASPLADPRLEALRRLAVNAWRRGYAIPAAEVERFLATGFSEAHVETLLVSVTGTRVRSTRLDAVAG